MKLNQVILGSFLISLININFYIKAQIASQIPPMVDSTVAASAPQYKPAPPIAPSEPDNLYSAVVKLIKRKKNEAVKAISTRTKTIITAHKRHRDLPSGRLINILRPDQFYYYLEHPERKMLIVAQFVHSSCHNCPRINPSLQQIAMQNIDVIFLNIDTSKSLELGQLARQFNVSRYPTFLCFKADRKAPTFRMSGTDADTLNNEINRLR